MSETDDAALLDIARRALDEAVRHRRAFTPDDPGIDAWRQPGGCFVTLKTGGRLRGCLGCFTNDGPLYRTVAEYTRLSALDDPRFGGDRMTAGDLDQPGATLSISVLSPLQPCADPATIRLGVDGIYIRAGGRAGCFLPQVADETGWSVEEFWGHCCRDKAGLAWDAWRRPGVEIFTFTARVIEGPAAL